MQLDKYKEIIDNNKELLSQIAETLCNHVVESNIFSFGCDEELEYRLNGCGVNDGNPLSFCIYDDLDIFTHILKEPSMLLKYESKINNREKRIVFNDLRVSFKVEVISKSNVNNNDTVKKIVNSIELFKKTFNKKAHSTIIVKLPQQYHLESCIYVQRLYERTLITLMDLFGSEVSLVFIMNKRMMNNADDRSLSNSGIRYLEFGYKDLLDIGNDLFSWFSLINDYCHASFKDYLYSVVDILNKITENESDRDYAGIYKDVVNGTYLNSDVLFKILSSICEEDSRYYLRFSEIIAKHHLDKQNNYSLKLLGSAYSKRINNSAYSYVKALLKLEQPNYPLILTIIRENPNNLQLKLVAARLYASGTGVIRDEHQALALYKDVYENGLSWGTQEYIQLLMNSQDEECNKLALSLGLQNLSYNSIVPVLVIKMYMMGVGTNVDYKAAFEVFDKCPNIIEKNEASTGLLLRICEESNDSALVPKAINILMKSKLSTRSLEYLLRYYLGNSKIQTKSLYNLLLKKIEEMDDKKLATAWLYDFDSNHTTKMNNNLINNDYCLFRQKREEIIDLHYRICPSNEPMNIMMISSNEYSKYAMVLIKSIKLNNVRPVNIYIITNGINSYNTDLLLSNIDEKTNVSIITIDTSIFNGIEVPRSINSGRWSPFGFCRLIPHLYLPESVDKVLSLGVDTLVDGDLSSLYDAELDDLALIGTINGPSFESIFINKSSDVYPCISADVILFNLKFFRENKVTLDYYSGKSSMGPYDEQLLAAAFLNHYKLVDTYQYNYRLDQTHRGIEKYRLLTKKPIIYQFIGNVKPWNGYFEPKDYGYDESWMLYSLENEPIIKKWWGIAKQCKNYNELYREMLLIRTALHTRIRRIIGYN